MNHGKSVIEDTDKTENHFYRLKLFFGFLKLTLKIKGKYHVCF